MQSVKHAPPLFFKYGVADVDRQAVHTFALEHDAHSAEIKQTSPFVQIGAI